MAAVATPAQEIEAEIRNQGVITFARFMELALYCPVYGYYEKEGDKIGRGGDYYTSVSVGRLFGQLLACQFAQWLGEGRAGPEEIARGDRAAPQSSDTGRSQIIEAGAHRGELAADVLRWMREQRPDVFQGLDYWIIEPSERRRLWQQKHLVEFGNKVHWAKDFLAIAETTIPQLALDTVPTRATLPPRIIFSNELLDSMPAHRLGWDARDRAWFEWGVTLENSSLAWTRLPIKEVRSPRTEVRSEKTAVGASLERLLRSLIDAEIPIELPTGNLPFLDVLPDGFTIEVCPAAEQWWAEATRHLHSGRLMAIDYGLSAEELFIPERKEGTLRAYRHHQVSQNLLANPGDQDLTAHVNFSALRQIGESAGLRTELFTTQAQFLTPIAASIWERKTPFGLWTPAHTRQFQALTHPEHLGRAFKVLVQHRPDQ